MNVLGTSGVKILHIIKLIHRICGWAAIIVSNFQVFTGLHCYDAVLKNYIFINYAAYIISFIALEIIHRLYFLKHKKFGSQEGFDANLPKMTLTQFNKNVNEGKRYVIYNKFVINLAPYSGEHPGGRHVMDPVIG